MDGTISIVVLVMCFAFCNGISINGATAIAPKTHTDHDGTLCPYKADIALLMDASSSIGPENYQQMKDFLRGVVRNFNIGPDGVQIGLVTFNFGAKIEFYLNTHQTKAEVLAAFDNIQNVTTGTATHRALKYARIHLFQSENGDRPHVPNLAILLTDGRSTHPDLTASEQALLKGEGVRIFAIGIGWIDEDELRLVASDPVDKYFHYVKDFSGLDEILSEFQQTSCAEITRPPPTTTLAPTTLPPTTTTVRICPYAADVMLLMDASSSIGPENFQQMITFLKGIVASFDIANDRVRIGLITYNHGARFEFHLNTYSTKAEIMTVFDSMSTATEVGTTTHAALKLARLEGFTEGNGSRPDLPHVAILVTDGRSNNPAHTATEQELLKQSGARIFAIGIGWTDVDELRLIASDPDDKYFHYVEHFDGLQNILSEFQETSCNEITRPQTTREECDAVGDIVFVLDSSKDISPYYFDLAKQLAVDIVKDIHVAGDKARIGFVKVHDDAVLEFPLDHSFDKVTVLKAIRGIQQTGEGSREDKAFQELKTVAFKNCMGAREYAPDIAIFITDGKFQNTDETNRQAAMASRAGTKVYSIGIGSHVDMMGVKSLLSQSPSASFLVSGQHDLHAIKKSLVSQICNK